jgi:molybdopterin-guanine dinucleotide biosynthesis protein A
MGSQWLGVVLCGGRSARMGREKSQLPHPRGGTFLQFAIDRLTPLCSAVVVSGRLADRCGVPQIEDPVPHCGPAGGIAATLAHAAQNSLAACLVTPVDLPDLTTADLLRLKDAWEETACLTIAWSDRWEPLVGIYPVSFADEIDALAKSCDRSLSRWLATQTVQAVPLSIASLRNVNTPEDLANGCEALV